MMASIKSYRVTLPDFSQVSHAFQEDIVVGLTSLWSALGKHVRFITRTIPLNFHELQAERDKLIARAPQEWQKRGLAEELYLARQQMEGYQMQQAEHWLYTYDSDFKPEALAGWRISAWEAPPPDEPSGAYIERIDLKNGSYLVPVRRAGQRWLPDPARNYTLIIGSYRLEGQWQLFSPLGEIINEIGGSLMVAVDSRRFSNEEVKRASRSWMHTLMTQSSSSNLDDADEATKAYHASRQALQSSNENIHHVRLLFMLLGPDVTQLQERAKTMRNKLVPYMQLEPMHGYQVRMAQMFSPKLRIEGAPSGHFNVLSSFLSFTAGMWGHHNTPNYRGIYIGQQRTIGGRAIGVKYLPMTPKEANHMTVFGRTGSGKTFGTFCLLRRAALQGWQVVILEPQGHSERFAQAMAANCSYHAVDSRALSINPLDPVEESIVGQAGYVITLLEEMLNVGVAKGAPNYRYITIDERAAVEQALQQTYKGYTWEEWLGGEVTTPRLGTFCRWLAGSRDGERLAYQLSRRFTGDALYAPVFDRQTNINLRLSATGTPAIVYNFKQVDDSLRRLVYFVVLASLYREVRNRPRPRILFVDELHWMADAHMMAWLASAIKTIRTFQASLWMADQNPLVLMGVQDREGNVIGGSETLKSGLMIIENATRTLCFPMEEKPAEQLADYYSVFRREHIHHIGKAPKPGPTMPSQAILRVDDRVDRVDFVPTLTELKLFGGT
jgi:hypothetical protein